MIKGIDVAVPQGVITLDHWRSIKASGVRFVFAKCGNGNDAPDPRFRANIDGARAVGLVVGAYHVGFPLPPDGIHAGRDAASQAIAHHAASAGLGERAGELPPVLDFEWPTPEEWGAHGVTAESARAWALEYLEAASRLWGRTPMLYTYPYFWRALAAAGDLSAFGAYPLWLARYAATKAGTLTPWAAPTIWQRSNGGGRLPSGAPVDEDVFLGDEAAFQVALGLEADPPTDAA